jgi:hypothetical protein
MVYWAVSTIGQSFETEFVDCLRRYRETGVRTVQVDVVLRAMPGLIAEIRTVSESLQEHELHTCCAQRSADLA